jgi:hydrogenase small subunit
MTGVLALPHSYTENIAHALSQETKRPPLVWLEFQDCAGNTESFLRASHPGVIDLVLDILSVDYHETIMAAAGHLAEEALDETIEANKGNYLLVVEGSIPAADNGIYCTIGGYTALEKLKKVSAGAAGIIAAGTCATHGGLPAASPNPTGAGGVEQIIKNVPVINLPGCPMNVQNLTALIVHYLTFNAWPATDQLGRPLFAYGARIHDDCERRAHFDSGQFVEEWGDEGHRKGWCLYKMGCKGPETFHNCPIVRWNDGASWPIGAGHGCVGCSEPYFWDSMSPFYERLPDVRILGTELTADQIGVGFVGGVSAIFAAHGVISAIRSQTHPLNQSKIEQDELEHQV